ncbi:MAG: hypothetical protein IKS87_05590 [Lachnospiraceae bacterium]|nr:hypothetical protein [Lachnospiraceae bacterium]
MLKIREEEIVKVNGGMDETGMIRAKFAIGDRVISISEPDLGVGTIVDMEFKQGWFYTVQMNGGQLYTSEDDLETPIM